MRRFSLSYLTAPMPTPVEQIEVAAVVGYDHLGLRLNPTSAFDLPSPLLSDRGMLETCRRMLDDTGLTVREIEGWMIRKGIGLAGSERVMEVAAKLGSPRLIAVGDLKGAVENAELEDRFAAFAELGHEFGLGVDFEPIAHRAAGNLEDALAVVTAGSSHGAGLILDMLHINRMGISAAELEAIDRRLLHNIHLCDAPEAPKDLETMIKHSAIDRDLPGEGVLPLKTYLDALPDRPLSIEIPMQRLAETTPPIERARMCLEASRRVFDDIDAEREDAAADFVGPQRRN